MARSLIALFALVWPCYIEAGQDCSAWTTEKDMKAQADVTAIALNEANDVFVLGMQDRHTTVQTDRKIMVNKISANGDWDWSFERTSTATDTFYMDGQHGIAVSKAGNVFITGQADGVLDGNEGARTGMRNLFVMKLLPTGSSAAWTFQRHSSAHTSGLALAVNQGGDVFVTGTTHGRLDGQSSYGDWDVFLMKINADSTWAWTLQGGSSGVDQGTAITLSEATGDIFIAGTTMGDMPGNKHEGAEDIFVMKALAAGTWDWTCQRGSAENDQPSAIVLDETKGDIFVTGTTAGSLVSIAIDSGNSATDLFIMKLLSNGTVAWTIQEGLDPSGPEDIAMRLVDSGVVIAQKSPDPEANYVWMRVTSAGSVDLTVTKNITAYVAEGRIGVNADGGVFEANVKPRDSVLTVSKQQMSCPGSKSGSDDGADSGLLTDDGSRAPGGTLISSTTASATCSLKAIIAISLVSFTISRQHLVLLA